MSDDGLDPAHFHYRVIRAVVHLLDLPVMQAVVTIKRPRIPVRLSSAGQFVHRIIDLNYFVFEILGDGAEVLKLV